MRSWHALLLPVILFRALIPAGFMPVIDADGVLEIRFCSGIVDDGQGAGPAHHHGHDDGTGEPAESGHHQLACPFAASAGLAPLPDFAAPVAAPAESLAQASGIRARQFVPTILRVQSPRAPPGVA